VTSRLAAAAGTAAAPWPGASCAACGGEGADDEGAVFAYLQDYYCDGSDTFACASFRNAPPLD
jgi:hypothetical protein